MILPTQKWATRPGQSTQSVMVWPYGTPPKDEERFQILDCAVELGETFWDTSE